MLDSFPEHDVGSVGHEGEAEDPVIYKIRRREVEVDTSELRPGQHVFNDAANLGQQQPVDEIQISAEFLDDLRIATYQPDLIGWDIFSLLCDIDHEIEKAVALRALECVLLYLHTFEW